MTHANQNKDNRAGGLCSLQHDFFSGLQVSLEEARAWANYEVVESLHDREENDWSRFGRLQGAWEKKNEDPNNILVEAARLKKPRQKSDGANALSAADNEISAFLLNPGESASFDRARCRRLVS